MNDREIIRIPGKVIILGEYAVLEGFPSVVGAVNRYVRMELVRSGKKGLHIFAQNLGKEVHIQWNKDSIEIRKNEPELELVVQAISLMLIEHRIDPRMVEGKELRIDSGDFYLGEKKLGFGSSAAVLTGLSALFMLADEGNPPVEERERIFHTARDLHFRLQRESGSGIDIAASTFGDIIRYQIPEKAKTNTFWEKIRGFGLCSGVVWTGHSTSTREMVEKVHRFRRESPVEYAEVMNKMGKIVARFLDFCDQENALGQMEQISLYYSTMEELGKMAGLEIISESHQKIREIVHQAGGVYKPSGAGGGDIGVFFADGKTSLLAIRYALIREGYKVVDIQWEKEGVHYEECN